MTHETFTPRPTPSIGRSPDDHRRRALTAAALLFALFSNADALPISPADGGALPDFITEILARDPNAFTYENAYIGLADRKAENRQRIADGELTGSVAELQQLSQITGEFAVPIFLGKFDDTGADPFPRQDFQEMLFDGPWPTGTMTQYYNEISYGALHLVGTVYDWVQVSDEEEHCTGTVNGLDPDFSNTGQFIHEILDLNDATVDFGQFDNDGDDGIPNSGDDDGWVDFIGIVHPEIGGECGGSGIWSHRKSLDDWPEGIYETNDDAMGGGKIRINGYTIMPAKNCSSGMIEIGVFCHEYGHAFGLPDLYDTNKGNGTAQGIGHWGLMGSGNWNQPDRPAHMCAWSKDRLGWLTPGVVATDLFGWPVVTSTFSPTAFKLWKNGTPGDEYFLVENRLDAGFDENLHAPGLLIWHVDDSVGGNGDETHKRVDLECADQTGADHTEDADDLDAASNRGDAGDIFCDGDAFGVFTTPSSVAYNGAATSVRVTNIHGCGGTSVVADLRVGVAGPSVDLCLRDCGGDTCVEPSVCDKWWASPEVYIDNNEDGIIDPPAEGIPNKLFARVRNVGTDDASDVDVSFYFKPPGMGLTFPSGGTFIDSDNISILPGGSTDVAGVLWDLPVPPPDVNHYCIGVIAENDMDGQSSEIVKEDDNLTQINVQALYAKAGDEVPPAPYPNPEWSGLGDEFARMTGDDPSQLDSGDWLSRSARTVAGSSGSGFSDEWLASSETFEDTVTVMACNPTHQTCVMDITIGSPPFYDDAVIPADWDVELIHAPLALAPFQCTPVRVAVRDNDPVHLDYAIIPLTLSCQGRAVGGYVLEFHIDNVPPEAPCTFSVKRTLPYETDDNPGHNAVVISWEDKFKDVGGWPERVERWRIYNGNSPDFPMNAATLLIETCIDENPETVPYEHFTDVPADLDAKWYKLVAVDRAGNESEACVAEIEIESTSDVDPDFASNHDGAVLMLAQNRPNPMNGSTKILYQLAEAGEVQVDVFTVHGRHVTNLQSGWLEAGLHSVTWDARNEDGTEVPNGVYVYRAQAGGTQESRRMIVNR